MLGAKQNDVMRFLFPKRFPKQIHVAEEIDTKKAKEIFGALLSVDDEKCGMYYNGKDPLRFKIPAEKAREIVAKSLDCARDAYAKLKEKFCDISPEDLCENLNIDVIIDNKEQGAQNAYIATFTERPLQIKLYSGMLSRILSFIEDKELYELSGMNFLAEMDANSRRAHLLKVMLYHELLHYFEITTPNIYTKSKLIEDLCIGTYSNTTSLISPGEIGATYFSKIAAKSPLHLGIIEMICLCMGSPEYAIKKSQELCSEIQNY